MGKSARCLNMKTPVRVPSTHVKRLGVATHTGNPSTVWGRSRRLAEPCCRLQMQGKAYFRGIREILIIIITERNTHTQQPPWSLLAHTGVCICLHRCTHHIPKRKKRPIYLSSIPRNVYKGQSIK